MTPARRDAIARALAFGAAAVVVVTVAVLTVDYARARLAAPADAARIETLQKTGRTDAAAATTLAAVEDAITRTRQARKARGAAGGVVLIAASAVFVAAMKWRITLRGARPAAAAVIPLATLRAHAVSADLGGAGQTRHRPPPDDRDVSWVDEIVARAGGSPEAAIPILQAIQKRCRYLPDHALARVCDLTGITPAQIAGTSSFYARFRRSPVGEHVVRVCHGTACHVSGARLITEELRRSLGIAEGEDTDPTRQFTIDEVACLGCCSLAPVLMVDDRTAGTLTPATAVAALDIAGRRETA